MILLQAQNPLNKSIYTFTKRQIRLQAPQARRSATVAPFGMHGVLDSYLGIEDPMNATTVTYQVRHFPREERMSADAIKRAIYQAVAPGMPQRLYFRDDDGNVWYADGAKSTGYPVDVTVGTPNYFDLQVSWRLNNPYLRLSHQAGELLWGDSNADGSPVLWGQTTPTHYWGESPNNFSTTASSLAITMHNPLGVVVTADVLFYMVCSTTSNYGPVTPGDPLAPGSNPSGIKFVNADAIFNNAPMEFRILDNLKPFTDPNTGVIGQDAFLFNPAGKQAVKASAGGIWRNIWKPANQPIPFVMVPGDNHITMSIVGTPLGSLGVWVNITWYPRTILM